MRNTTQELYQATKTLLRAFQYLEGRMRGGQLAPPMPMNAEALAGCILHQCMARLVREIQLPPSCRQSMAQAARGSDGDLDLAAPVSTTHVR